MPVNNAKNDVRRCQQLTAFGILVLSLSDTVSILVDTKLSNAACSKHGPLIVSTSCT